MTSKTRGTRNPPLQPSTSVACVAATLLALATPLSGQQCPERSSADSLAVVNVARGIIEADNARALERVLAFYAPDAILMPPGEPPVHGRDQIRPRYEALFAAYDPEIVSAIDEVAHCGDVAVVSGRNGGVLTSRTASSDRVLGDVFVMVLRKRDDAWRITRLIWHSDHQ